MTDYGRDISVKLRTQTLPFPDGTVRTFQAWDATADFQEVTGRDLLIEALLRRLITPRGTLVGDPDYGTDVRQWINDDIDDAEAARIGAAIAAELGKDERVRSASATTTFVDNLLSVTISLVDGAGPFKLTLAITDVTLKLLGVTS